MRADSVFACSVAVPDAAFAWISMEHNKTTKTKRTLTTMSEGWKRMGTMAKSCPRCAGVEQLVTYGGSHYMEWIAQTVRKQLLGRRKRHATITHPAISSGMPMPCAPSCLVSLGAQPV